MKEQSRKCKKTLLIPFFLRLRLTNSSRSCFRIQFGAAGFDCVDYYGFFHMFLFSYVSNLRECLQEWLTRATAEKDSGVGNNPLLKLLPGEIVTFAPNERLHWSVFGGKSCKQPFFVPGVMYMTNYRIVLISTRYVL